MLKTKGYHLEHNFGHGKEHLSSLLATLNLLAFGLHTFVELTDADYQLIRTTVGARRLRRFIVLQPTGPSFRPCRSDAEAA